MQSYSTPERKDSSDIERDLDDDTKDSCENEDSFEDFLKELKYESPKIDSEDSFEELFHELKYESPKIDSDNGSECYLSDDEVLDYMGCYNTQTFSSETNVELSLDL